MFSSMLCKKVSIIYYDESLLHIDIWQPVIVDF